MRPASGYIPAFSMAATEIPVRDFVLDQNGKDAVNLEIAAMTTKSFGGMRPRLIKMTAEEASTFNDHTLISGVQNHAQAPTHLQ